jgi:hypothetical protein
MGLLAPRPVRFTPGKDPVPTVQEAGWAPGAGWTGAENLTPTGIRCPDRPDRSELLYRLSNRGPQNISIPMYTHGPYSSNTYSTLSVTAPTHLHLQSNLSCKSCKWLRSVFHGRELRALYDPCVTCTP